MVYLFQIETCKEIFIYTFHPLICEFPIKDYFESIMEQKFAKTVEKVFVEKFKNEELWSALRAYAYYKMIIGII